MRPSAPHSELRDPGKRLSWLCRPCWAYVGCHPGTEVPLGTLADAATRKARSRAHAAFDPLWKSGAFGLSRAQAYAWLREVMGLTKETGHIAMMDAEQCDRLGREVVRRNFRV